MPGQEIPPPNRMFTILQEIHVRHERLKRYVHDGFRYPLPTWGRYMMGFVYFTIPVVGGWHIMQWAISKAHVSIGEHGEKLEKKTITGIGDQRGSDGKHIGAGGWGGGVHLAVSDEETQRRNRKKLNKFLKSLQQKDSTTSSNTPTKNESNN